MANRYENTSKIDREGVSGRASTIYKVPAESIEDYYVISVQGDRFDILAKEYYGSESYWYILATANPHVKRDALTIPAGHQLRIPLPLSKVLTTLNSENNNR